MLPVAAALVRLDGPGPLFRKEVRVGRDRRAVGTVDRGSRRLHDVRGEPFRLLSFRVDRRADGARGPFGHLVAALRLEPLPQVLALLTGRVALVGPRAPSPDFLDDVHRRCPELARRLCRVRPGLVGPVPRGPATAAKSASERLAERLYLDGRYVERLLRCRGVDVLALDLGVLARALVPGLVPRRASEVRVELPAGFVGVDLAPDVFADALPASRPDARVTRGDAGLTATWTALATVRWPAPEGGVLEGLCDELLVEEDRLRASFRLGARSPQVGADLVRVELPPSPADAGAACHLLRPLWDALVERTGGSEEVERMGLAFLEGLAYVAARSPRAERLAVELEVGPRRLEVSFEAVSRAPVRRAVEAVNAGPAA